MEMSPVSPADCPGSTESAVISTVEISATTQPIHTFLPGHSPASIASSGVSMHVACRGCGDPDAEDRMYLVYLKYWTPKPYAPNGLP